MSCDVGEAHCPTILSLYLRPSSFSNPSVASPTVRHSSFSNPSFASPTWALLILQPFRHFTYVTDHSPTLPSLYLRHNSFYNPSVASPTSQLILQPFFRLLRHRIFTYITWRAAHGCDVDKAEFILQPFRHFTYVTAHSPTLPSLYLDHSSFSNPSVASPTSRLIIQPFFRFSYVAGSSLGEPPMLKSEYALYRVKKCSQENMTLEKIFIFVSRATSLSLSV